VQNPTFQLWRWWWWWCAMLLCALKSWLEVSLA